MSKTTPSIFLPPEETRLVTICAHVDHGKTTLADNLIESNGIISERLAGTLRYLDFMEEEQRRGITMRASAIGLRHQYVPPPGVANKKHHHHQQQQQQQQQHSTVSIIVHLLDSPGHTDFSTEVSSSLQCCDGCLLVVDAVEGMCARTHQVVREAYSHQLVPILVINKVDRLCTNLCLTPTEAYLRLRSLLESVNAACAAVLLSKRAEEPEQNEEPGNNNSQSNNKSTKGDSEREENEELRWTFDPQRGNVIFASALFGWGFSVPALARSLFRNKTLPIKPVMLKQYLFGDFYFKPDEEACTGKIMKWKGGDQHQHQQQQPPPLFAEYGLQPLWDVYEGVASAAVVAGLGSSLFADGRIGDSHQQKKGSSSDGIKIQATMPGMDEVLRAIQIGSTATVNGNSFVIQTSDQLQQILTRTGSSSSEEGALRSLLRRFRPLSDCVLSSVYEVCPSPIEAAEHIRPRALALAKPSFDETIARSQEEGFERIQRSIQTCDTSDEAPTTAYVCKFMAADRSQIRDPAHVENESESSTVILGLVRVLCGRLRTGDSYHVMGPKHRFGEIKTMAKSRPVKLFLLMGSSFVLVNEVPAGHLCAVQNLEDFQYKTATLCDSPYGMPLRGFNDTGIHPLVKVNVETVDPADTPWLEKGLVKLSLADASVEVTATAKGERILACLGELHLEQSLLDLQKVYCDKEVELRISEPIVEFGETTAWFGDNEMDFSGFLSDSSKKTPPLRQLSIPPYNEEEGIENTDRGRCRSIVSGRVGAISLRAVPLDPIIFESMKQQKTIQGSETALEQLKNALGLPKDWPIQQFLASLGESIVSVDHSGNAMVVSSALQTGKTVVGVQGEEIFVNRNLAIVNEESDASVTNGEVEFHALQNKIRDTGFAAPNCGDGPAQSPLDAAALQVWEGEMRGSLVAGFQMAMRHGPICEEPVRHVLIVLEGLELALKEDATAQSGYKTASSLSGGMVAAALRIGIRSALLSRPARLVESHLKLTLNSSLTGLGPLYQVLSRRRGKVLEDSMVDGTDLLLIEATIPHAESFGLAPELFRMSSGEVTAPELIFSHWEILDQDPFWIPSTLEEREDFGEILQSGDVSTGLDNTALKYIRKVRERKGLLVDSSRTVVAAEKQRTIKR
ncbi:translation elongation factor aEF-2 [Nitzschia inconspicua]|uniref:Translation elongation factor aEF-2 n=1 Tax=Nitzschia inconspicua TaxID=303405 RepID=A0A9K3LTM7_9STRA|nr:translation elongation factor aEF-2 [Nitzschia inconspicua]